MRQRATKPSRSAGPGARRRSLSETSFCDSPSDRRHAEHRLSIRLAGLLAALAALALAPAPAPAEPAALAPTLALAPTPALRGPVRAVAPSAHPATPAWAAAPGAAETSPVGRARSAPERPVSMDQLLELPPVSTAPPKRPTTDETIAAAVELGPRPDLEPRKPFRKHDFELFRSEHPVEIGQSEMLLRLRLRAKSRETVSVELHF